MQIKIIKRERVRELEGMGYERRRKFIQITPMNISYSLSTQQNANRIARKNEREKFI